MVIVILAIIVVASVPFITTVLDAWVFSKTERDMVFGSRLALNRMVREIRQIKNSTDYITTWSAAEFNFTDMNDNVIDYRQSNILLLRNANELASVLTNPGGLNFAYLDSSGFNTTVKTNIRMVRIRLNLTLGENNMLIESLAKFRNIE